jgi:hypothetical protein
MSSHDLVSDVVTDKDPRFTASDMFDAITLWEYIYVVADHDVYDWLATGGSTFEARQRAVRFLPLVTEAYDVAHMAGYEEPFDDAFIPDFIKFAMAFGDIRYWLTPSYKEPQTNNAHRIARLIAARSRAADIEPALDPRFKHSASDHAKGAA